MIPHAYTIEWQQYAPWTQEVQVEQDLIISRALVELFRCPAVANTLAFRGGTALYKLFIRPPLRYSEDIDLVQLQAAPIGEVLTAIRGTLDPWLGAPLRKRTQGRVVLIYRMMSEPPLALPLRLKIEINTREHFSVFGVSECDFAVDSRWFRGSTKIPSYSLDELLGTKLRALYQRKKGRDLFDLAIALRHQNVNTQRVVEAFREYLHHEQTTISRAEFEQNLRKKLDDASFRNDITPLLSPNANWDANAAAALVQEQLIAQLPGNPAK